MQKWFLVVPVILLLGSVAWIAANAMALQNEGAATTQNTGTQNTGTQNPGTQNPGTQNPGTQNTVAKSTVAQSVSSGDVNFDKMMDVLTHRRCVNCHPSDGVPRQGEDSHPHYFGIERGEANVGFDATKCNTCHQTENNEFSGVPGAPEWSLAPHKMRWQGLTRVEIAKSILDPKRNGNRTPEEVMHHLTEHKLVLWAWTPGVDANGTPREKPPVPVEEYTKAVKQWFKDGAKIPGN